MPSTQPKTKRKSDPVQDAVQAAGNGAIRNRYDFVLLFDVKNGNPNGDPDAGNMPRMDPETGHGTVSDVCLKRKVRNYVSLAKGDEPGYGIYMAEKAILNNQHRRAYEGLGIEPEEKRMPKDTNLAAAITRWMCDTFYDVRAFGAVMDTAVNAGQVRGPVQIMFANSIEPISPVEVSITRSSVTNERDADKERTMGNKYIVPYGLYRVHGFVSGRLANDPTKGTGFSVDDLSLFWRAMTDMFETDRAASRGEMSTRRLIVFEHESDLGNAHASRLFERVTVNRVAGSEGPARSFADYEVRLDGNGLPAGVKVLEFM